MIVDFVVSVITIAVVATGAIMAVFINYFKPPNDFMETANHSFLPTDKDALQLLFEARPERKEWLEISRERVSVSEFEWMVALVDQPYDDQPQNLEFKCPGVQLDRCWWYMGPRSDTHKDMLFSPFHCTVGLRRPFLRFSSDHFWEGGGVMDIVGWQSFPTSDDRAVVRWFMRDDMPKPVKKAYRVNRIPEGGLYDWNNVTELLYLEWGSEMMHGLDMLAQEGLYLTVFDTRRSICETLKDCNSYHYVTNVTIELVESWDPAMECCLEGVEFIGIADKNFHHGKMTGMPLFEAVYEKKSATRKTSQASYYVIRSYANEIKFDTNFVNQNMIKYYRVFTATGAAGEMQQFKQDLKIKTLLYAKYSAKKFYMHWFRYTGRNSGWQPEGNPVIS